MIVAALAEVNLVQIQLKDTILAVTVIHQQRHVGFIGLTPQRTLVGQEQVFYQLLRQGTAALHRTSGGQVSQHRTTDGVRADAVMLIEVTVFGGNQRIHQQVRETGARHEQPLFAVRRLQHGDQTRIETEEAEAALVFHVLDIRETVVLEIQTRVDLPFFAVREIKRTTQQLNAVGLHGKLTRARHAAYLAVLHALE
ncbi:hypothetical protein D3C80_566020 [compost metagenome]